MGSKAKPGLYDCAENAHPEEPMFTLRGQDLLSPDLVREWADRAEANGCPKEKVEEARACADEMERWPNRKFPD